jgi:hypothetical protein
MLIYNVTTKVALDIHVEWLNWMKEEHIPEVLATEMFSHHLIVRLLETDESDGMTYAVQYFSSSRELYENYINHFAPVLREKALKRWGSRIISFRTLMEVIN